MQSSLNMYNLDILKIVRQLRTLEFTQSLEGTCRLLLAASLNLGLDLLGGLPPDQGLLLRRLHLPDDQRGLPSRGLGLVARIDHVLGEQILQRLSHCVTLGHNPLPSLVPGAAAVGHEGVADSRKLSLT